MTQPGENVPAAVLPGAITLANYHREHPTHVDNPNTEAPPELADLRANHPPTWFTSPDALYLPAYDPDHVYSQRFYQAYIDAYYQNILSQNDSIERLRTRSLILEETNAALRSELQELRETDRAR